MIRPADRQQAVTLINEAHRPGARLSRVCAELGLTVRTYQRWTQEAAVKVDGRPGAVRPVPANQLSAAEQAAVLAVCHEPPYASLPPGQIVPRLADEGTYLASEATFYRLLRQADEQHHRGGGPKLRAHPARPPGWWHGARTKSGPGTSAGCRDRSRGCFSTST